MIKHNFDVTVSGSRIIDIPICQYEFVNIVNNTSFPFALYNSNSTALVDLIGFVPPSTVISLPHPKTVNLVNVVWVGTTVTIPQRCSIYYTNESLGWGSNLNPLGLGVPAAILKPSTRPLIINEMLFLGFENTIPLGVVTRFTCFANTGQTSYDLCFEPSTIPTRGILSLPAGVIYEEDNIEQNITLHVRSTLLDFQQFTIITWR